MAITGLTGILNSFTTPLKEAKIPVFAISTWLAKLKCAITETVAAKSVFSRNTDYFLVPANKVDDAVGVLKNDGWVFRNI
jgi:hypothetical protein